jgi:hypothetical protein
MAPLEYVQRLAAATLILSRMRAQRLSKARRLVATNAWSLYDPNSHQKRPRPPPYPTHARSADYAPVPSRGGPRHEIGAKTQQAQGSGLFNKSWCAALRPMFVRASSSAPAHAGLPWQRRALGAPTPEKPIPICGGASRGKESLIVSQQTASCSNLHGA